MPSSKKSTLMHILNAIDAARPEGETSLSTMLFELAQKIKRRGIVILLSDLLDDPETVIKALRSFHYRKHEILVFQILDPTELSFSFHHSAVFYDLEDNEELIVQPDALRASYQKRFKEVLKLYHHRLFEAHIDYEVLYTHTPYDRALFTYLEKRKKLP